VRSSDVDYSFTHAGVVLESDLVAPCSCAVDNVVTLYCVHLACDSVLEHDSLDLVCLLILDEIDELSLVKDVGSLPSLWHLPVALGSSQQRSHHHSGIIERPVLINDACCVLVGHEREKLPQLGLVHESGEVKLDCVLGCIMMIDQVVDNRTHVKIHGFEDIGRRNDKRYLFSQVFGVFYHVASFVDRLLY